MTDPDRLAAIAESLRAECDAHPDMAASLVLADIIKNEGLQ